MPASLRTVARQGLLVILVLPVLAGLVARPAAQGSAAGPPAVIPQYDAGRNLILPADYREWVLIGSSLGLSYAEGAQGRQMFHATLMEPTAYRHFLERGEFREGTMLALLLQGVGSGAAPARQGQFGTDLLGVELAVKDRGRVAEGWAYYAFGAGSRLLTAAAPQPKARCFDCHEQHAATDKVFTQFYGLLRK